MALFLREFIFHYVLPRFLNLCWLRALWMNPREPYTNYYTNRPDLGRCNFFQLSNGGIAVGEFRSHLFRNIVDYPVEHLLCDWNKIEIAPAKNYANLCFFDKGRICGANILLNSEAVFVLYAADCAAMVAAHF